MKHSDRPPPDDEEELSARKPRIDPSGNPRLAKALDRLNQGLREGEDPLYYDWRKRRTPKVMTSGGSAEARAYVSATTVPPTRDHKTIEMERVKISAGLLDPRRAETLPSMRMSAGATNATNTPLEHPLAETPSPPAQAVASQASTGSRTVGGRTERLSVEGPPPEPFLPTRSPRLPPVGPEKTLGGRTERLPNATPPFGVAIGSTPPSGESTLAAGSPAAAVRESEEEDAVTPSRAIAAAPTSPWAERAEPQVNASLLPSSLAPHMEDVPSSDEHVPANRSRFVPLVALLLFALCGIVGASLLASDRTTSDSAAGDSTGQTAAIAPPLTTLVASPPFIPTAAEPEASVSAAPSASSISAAKPSSSPSNEPTRERPGRARKAVAEAPATAEPVTPPPPEESSSAPPPSPPQEFLLRKKKP